MNGFIKRYSKLSLLLSIILVIAGGIFIFNPTAVAVTITTILGVGILLYGIVYVVRFFVNRSNIRYYNLDFTSGIVATILGFILIFNPRIISQVIPILIGIFIVMQGAFKLQYSFQLKDMLEKNWLVLFVISILTLIGGLIVLFNPAETSDAIVVLIGVIMVAEGIANIVEYISLINVMDKLDDFMKN